MKMKSSDLLKIMILIFVFILTYLFSSLHTILSEEKPFNSGYHVVVDNKI